jgi:hypothetical protein
MHILRQRRRPSGATKLLRAHSDSFVVETNVHYPTDINLLFDATRKTIAECT